MIVSVHTITFMDEDGVVLLTVLADDGSDFVIPRDYEPHDSKEVFKGWYVQGAQGVNDPIYAKNQTITNVTGPITFVPAIVVGVQLTFIENDGVGGGATYVPPIVLEKGTDTLAYMPDDASITRPGYEFAGWYYGNGEDGSATLGELYVPGPIDDDTTIYAKWEPADSKYTVIIWTQSVEDDYRYGREQGSTYYDATISQEPKHYDFKSQKIIEEVSDGENTVHVKAGDSINTNDFKDFINDNKPAKIGKSNYYSATGFESYRIEYSNAGDGNTVNGNGTTVVNIYYDRSVFSITFKQYPTYTYKEVTNGSTTGDQFGKEGDNYFRIYYNPIYTPVVTTDTDTTGDLYGITGDGGYNEIRYLPVYVYSPTNSDSGTQYGTNDGGDTFFRIYHLDAYQTSNFITTTKTYTEQPNQYFYKESSNSYAPLYYNENKWYENRVRHTTLFSEYYTYETEHTGTRYEHEIAPAGWHVGNDTNSAFYEGTRYTRSSSEYAWFMEYNEGAAYNTPYTGDRYKMAASSQKYWFRDQANHHDNTDAYNGARFTRTKTNETTPKTIYGLYGQSFDEYGYEWPEGFWRGKTDSNSLYFLSSFNGTFFVDPNYSPDYQTYDHGNITLSTANNASQTYTAYLYLKKADGEYRLAGKVPATGDANARFNISDRFKGYEFEKSKWTTSNSMPTDGWNYVTIENTSNHLLYTSDQRQSNTYVHVCYKPVVNKLLFYDDQDYGYTDVLGSVPLAYGMKLTKYEPDELMSEWEYRVRDISDPIVLKNKQDYYFKGWYSDAAGTQPFDWSQSMGVENIPVFAKYAPLRYRVFIHMNGGTIDSNTTFRKNPEESISLSTITAPANSVTSNSPS